MLSMNSNNNDAQGNGGDQPNSLATPGFADSSQSQPLEESKDNSVNGGG